MLHTPNDRCKLKSHIHGSRHGKLKQLKVWRKSRDAYCTLALLFRNWTMTKESEREDVIGKESQTRPDCSKATKYWPARWGRAIIAVGNASERDNSYFWGIQNALFARDKTIRSRLCCGTSKDFVPSISCWPIGNNCNRYSLPSESTTLKLISPLTKPICERRQQHYPSCITSSPTMMKWEPKSMGS